MTIVYFGSDEFAAKVLAFLLEEKHPIIAVVTATDKPKGRSKKPSATPVKELISKHYPHLALHQPEKASSQGFVQEMQKLAPELFVVVSYGQILKAPLLAVPTLGPINVHPSLLPKYRGPSPIQSAVLSGEKETGVTIMEMSLEMDAGDIITTQKISLDENATFGQVHEALCQISSTLLSKTLKKILKEKSYQKTPQDHSQATYTKKIFPEDGDIDFRLPAWQVHNLIRGMSPKPGARCQIEVAGKIKNLKILRSSIVDVELDLRLSEKNYQPGEIVFYHPKEGFIISCKESFLQLHALQLEGGREMQARDFINGFPRPVFKF